MLLERRQAKGNKAKGATVQDRRMRAFLWDVCSSSSLHLLCSNCKEKVDFFVIVDGTEAGERERAFRQGALKGRAEGLDSRQRKDIIGCEGKVGKDLVRNQKSDTQQISGLDGQQLSKTIATPEPPELND
jgi:hypothetical protein